METKQIQCPNCGVILDVRNSKDETLKIITCPQCKATLRVKFRGHSIPSEPLDAETFLPQKQSSQKQTGGETLLAGSALAHKQASLIAGNREYGLKEGVNTIGRKSQTSSATILIATDDHYMSRRHSKISIAKNNSGAIKAVISNDQNKNATTVDGQILIDDDEVILTDGDKIVMGKTEMVYKEK